LLKIKCVYCGQKILAGDDKMGTKAHCPKCDHVIFINEAVLIKGDEKDLSKAEIDLLLEKSKAKSEAASSSRPDILRRRHRNFLTKWLVPDFDELSLFLMVAAAVLVAGTNNGLDSKVEKFVEAISGITPGDGMIVMLGIACLILFGGAGLSVFHVFSKREKYEWEKVVMLIFAVVFTAGSGIFAGKAMLEEAGQGLDLSFNSQRWISQIIALTKELTWQTVFPLWNIANGTLLLYLLRSGMISTSAIVDRDVKLWEVLLGLIILVVVFLVCQYGFETHWAVTYSVCVVYSTNFVKWGWD